MPFTNIRKEWAKACAAVGLGTLEPVDGNGGRRYSGLLVHDLRRSAIKNLMRMGVSEKVAMTIGGHKTRAVFDRYHIVDVGRARSDAARIARCKFGEKCSGQAEVEGVNH